MNTHKIRSESLHLRIYTGCGEGEAVSNFVSHDSCESVSGVDLVGGSADQGRSSTGHD